VLANDTDPDLDALEAVLVDGVTSGVLVLNADGSFDYTPAPDFSGADAFTYRANDGDQNSNLATVTFSVADPSDPDGLVHLPLDEGGGIMAGDVSGAGNDGALVGGASLKADDFIPIIQAGCRESQLFR